MDVIDNGKSFVVYSGRRPEAVMAWEFFCKSFMNERREKIRHMNNREDASGSLTKMVGSLRYGSEFVESRNSNTTYIAEWSMQVCLRQACHKLGIAHPNYTRVEGKNVDGHIFYRYRGSLPIVLLGIPPVSLGRFASDENEAREDVALLLLQRLKAATSMRIIDYNYHNVLWMEDYIKKLEGEVEELVMVNATLSEEMKLMQNDS
ncbi:hypothetical protein SESBI_40529 [Sesbania bispinosa]|nr:hypothetical protein SESBI_40529 [Sesbania bispinosa]